ncbi:CDP-glycerol glycerophosphotransferase family protein [Terrisporobacter glycolicus]|nr:CDP-glycerol glycerophosphotransferase family protein [Terrisporobacter glycolicus]
MKFKKKVRKLIEILCSVIGFVNPIIQKKQNKIFIYNSKPGYQNNYAIYNYIIENKLNEKYKIYYYMPGIENVIKKEKNIYLNYGLLKSMLHYITAKYVFFDTGNIRIRPSKNQIVMNLWHGTPFKSIGFLSKNVEKDLPRNLMNTFSQILVSSSNMKDVYIKSFNLNNDQIFFSGHPRNDLLLSNKDVFSELNIDRTKFDKVIMWMTTYRISKDGRLCHTSNENWSDTDLPLITNHDAIIKMNEILKKNNILLLLKMHTTSKESKVIVEGNANIKVLEEQEYISKNIQLYEILGKTDALITDYSSVFIDYLLLNRPIGFIVDDIEDYEDKNGFNLEKPLDYMPGKHIYEFDDLEKFFNNLSTNANEYEEKRIKVSKYFNEYNYENNCKFILDSMGIKI